MTVHIVTNHGTMDGIDKPYSESIKVFKNAADAVKQFREWRGPDTMSDCFGFDVNIGSKIIYKCAKIDVELFTTELIE